MHTAAAAAAAAETLKRLVKALEKDVSRSSKRSSEDLGDAINAALVLHGVRSGALLDHSYYTLQKPPAALLRAVTAEARRLKAKVKVLKSEAGHLIVFDATAVSAPDQAVLGSSGWTNDMQEPVLGAMGRALGYACTYPQNDEPRRIMHFEAVLHGRETASEDSVWLAGFFCKAGNVSHGDDGDKGDDVYKACVDRWLAPAMQALGGAMLSYHGRSYMLSFRLATSKVRARGGARG